VSPGSEPERDDSGLPPVDVQIPDDARELDFEVQAYRRELRARRRLLRTRRLRGLLGRESMVIPLLICCLVFALISGTLLTLFTATSIDQNLPRQPSGATSASRPSPARAPDLASDLVAVTGKPSPQALGSLRPALVLLVRCSCTATAQYLAGLAASHQVPAYLLYTSGGRVRAEQLARQVGHGVTVASDVSGRLAHGHSGLTAFLVTHGGAVTYEDRLQSTGHLDQLLLAAGVIPASAPHA
jgi:hypothetical protein